MPRHPHLKGFTPEQRDQIRMDVSKMRQFMNRLFAGGPEVFGAAGGNAAQTFAWGTNHEIALNVAVRCTSQPVPIGEGLEFETPGDVVRAAKKVRFEKEPEEKEPPKELRVEDLKKDLKEDLKEKPMEEDDSEIESVSSDSSESDHEMPPPALQPKLKSKPKPKRPRKEEEEVEEQEEAMWERLSKRLDMEDRKRLREDRMLERMRKSRQVRGDPPAFMEPNPVVGVASDLETLPPVPGPSQQYHQPGYMPPESYAKRVQKREYPHVPHPDEYSPHYPPPQQPMPPPPSQPAITSPPVYNDPRVLQSYNSSGGVVMRLKTV